MIYVVSNQASLFDSNEFKFLSVEESLNKLSKWDCIQFDSETTGRDPHLCTLLCIQFGNIEGTEQIIVDTSTVNIKIYKNILENSYLIGQNLKFDLQFLYNYSIIPRKVYDTMIVEQFLYLGYPAGIISYSLKSIAERRLGIDIDKSVRGEIIWRGLDTTVIKYAAGDVQYLGDIMKSQIEDLKKRTNALIGAKIECDFTPAIAYLEWCGIKLDEKKWKDKMNKDLENLRERKKSLDKFLVNNNMNKYFHINKQGDLFEGFSTEPVIDINWSSSTQVIKVAKDLGFDTQVKDKKTGENKDSVLEKHLKTQKGVNDEFLKLYFDYQESAKVVSSFGQGHLNSINPKTGRLHTQFKALGASSSRMSCGSNKPNIDLAKYKQLPSTACKYLNLQQLPSDELTRSCFIAPKGYKFVSADFSAEESRLAADIYQDKEFLKEFTTGSKDTHNMFAWIVYNKECKECGCKDATEVKEKAPKWRKLVKGFELSYSDSYR